MLLSVLLSIESIPSLWELASAIGRDQALLRVARDAHAAVERLGARLGTPVVRGDCWGYCVHAPPGVSAGEMETAVRDAVELGAERVLLERERKRLELGPLSNAPTEMLNRIARRVGLRGLVLQASAGAHSRYVFSPDDAGDPIDLGRTLREAIVALNRTTNPKWPMPS